MRRRARTWAIAAALLFPAAAAGQHGHHQHASGPQQKDVKMTVHPVASDALEIRLGPYDLPAHTSHEAML